MGATATLNVRLPKELKEHGSQVLDRNGLSVSDAVRGLYEYLQDNQCLPAFLEEASGGSLYERRRELARSMVGIVSIPNGFDARCAHDERLTKRCGEFL